MADLLTNLSNKYKCDKSDKRHGYTPLYHDRFYPYRNDTFNLLEFGFGKGKSVRMWLDYFSEAKIISVDVRDNPTQEVFKNSRFKYVKADQIDVWEMESIISEYYEFKIIIDDASHVPEDQQFTFGYMFPFVESGGWYVIEDLKCRRNHSTRLPQCEKTIPVLQRFQNTRDFTSPCLTGTQKDYIRTNVKDVKIYDKIAFIRKR